MLPHADLYTSPFYSGYALHLTMIFVILKAQQSIFIYLLRFRAHVPLTVCGF